MPLLGHFEVALLVLLLTLHVELEIKYFLLHFLLIAPLQAMDLISALFGLLYFFPSLHFLLF